MCHVGEDWERASSLPPEHRVVINDGSVLPENDISCAIAAEAKATGMLRVACCLLVLSHPLGCYLNTLRGVAAMPA